MRERLTAKTVTEPSSARTAVACSRSASPYFAVSYVGESTRTSRTSPRPYFEAWEKGKNVVWRQAGPPGSVMIGAMTLTSCARQATVTRSACRSRAIRSEPKTTASMTL